MLTRLREHLRAWLGVKEAETMLALEIARAKRRWERVEPHLPPVAPYPDPNLYEQPAVPAADGKVLKGYGQPTTDRVDPGTEPGDAHAE